MSFDVQADAYARFMGRYSEPLAAQFAALAAVTAGRRAVDVGCGTGALTAKLVDLIGTRNVSAVDPSAPLLAAVRERFPLIDVQQGTAERMPFGDGEFDYTLAQLVVHFMADPVAGLRDMARVTRPGGVVAACVWDHNGGRAPVSVFWQAVRDLDPDAPDESDLPGTREGQLAELFTAAGLHDIKPGVLTVRVRLAGFADWWEPFTYGVGPAGDHVRRLDDRARAELRDRCRQLLPMVGPIDITASAWTALGQPS
jgi:SAM-dependent methyltransferase